MKTPPKFIIFRTGDICIENKIGKTPLKIGTLSLHDTTIKNDYLPQFLAAIKAKRVKVL